MTLSLVLLLHCRAMAQTMSSDSLANVIYEYNNAFEYNRSIALLSQMLAEPNLSASERSRLYLYKASTYKRVFNYEQVMYYLDLAIKEASLSPDADSLLVELKAEKAFAFFDTQAYRKAESLMKELEARDYKYLDPQHIALLLIQASFLRIKEKDYSTAEKTLDRAIELARKYSPDDLPLAYGKKIHLYNATGRYNLRDSAFREGYREAEKTGLVKYQMYLYEVLKGELYTAKEYAAALEAHKKYDSLAYLYDYSGYSGRAQILDKKIENEKKLQELTRQKKQKSYLLIVVLLLLLVIPGLQLYRRNQQKSSENNLSSHDIYNLSHYELTLRQKEIISLAQQGKSNKEIADILFISENTVKYHLKSIYETLSIKRRTQLQPFHNGQF